MLAQQIEIEYKNLLTKLEYEALLNHFKIETHQIKQQINHYFDTAEFALKNLRSALRIREKEGCYELTLKQPAEVGLLETNQSLTKDDAENMFNNARFPEGAVKVALETVGVDIESIEFFGTLTTLRAELEYMGGLLVFDSSRYLNAEDFELEYEVTDPGEGKAVFRQLLETMNIPLRKTDNKIQRFYNQKYQA
ncbi:CYTH domain-containing protein [Bacillus sp. DNRA2]|nr:CYTH domain-containing protein [Bacillus sp. DNRA2]